MKAKALRKLTQSVRHGQSPAYVVFGRVSPRAKDRNRQLPDTARGSLLQAEFVFLEVVVTPRASLSGTFLQTLSELVTPLKEHSLSPRSCPPTLSAPSEMFGCLEDCGGNIASKHALTLEARPPRLEKKKKRKKERKKERKKKESRVLSQFKRFWFYLCWRKQPGRL